jgi:hypothetical protein
VLGFGCTEERLLHITIGCKERGDPSQRTFSHTTGEGWVQAKEGHYDDAIHTKHNSVKVMIFDDLGGATPGTAKIIKDLAKNASGKGARDATDYMYGETHYKMLLPTPLHRHITRMRARLSHVACDRPRES